MAATVGTVDGGDSPSLETSGLLKRNIAALAGSQVLTWSMSMAATLVVPKALGPSGMGVISAALSATSILAILIGFVTVDYLVRAMVVDDRAAPLLAGAAIVVRALMIPVFFAAIGLYVRLTHMPTGSSIVFYVLGVAAIANVLADPLQARFKSTQRMTYTAWTNLILNSGSGVVAIVLVLLGGRVVALAVATAVASVVALALSWFWARRHVGLAFRGAIAVFPAMARKSLPFWPLQMVSMVYLYVDTLILSTLDRTTVVGWYGVASRLFGTLLFVPTILATAWYPRLIASFETAGTDFRKEARSFLSLIPALSLPIAAATALGATPVIRFVYGQSYSGAAPVMEVLGICVIPMYLGIALGQVLMAMKRPTTLALLLLGGVVINVLCNLILIPAFDRSYSNGALGAAVSLLITETLITGGQLLVAGRRIIDRALLRRLPGSLAASGTMYAVGMLLRPWGLASLPIAALAFLPVAVASRAVTVQELKTIVALPRTVLRRRASP